MTHSNDSHNDKKDRKSKNNNKKNNNDYYSERHRRASGIVIVVCNHRLQTAALLRPAGIHFPDLRDEKGTIKKNKTLNLKALNPETLKTSARRCGRVPGARAVLPSIPIPIYPLP